MTTQEAHIKVSALTWQEARYDAPDGESAFASADFSTAYAGDLVGTSNCRLLIAYTSGDPEQPSTLGGEYVGLERVSGTLAGRTGSFAFEARGQHVDGAAHTSVRVIPGSGTGQLAGLSGEGEYVAAAQEYELTLRYDLA